MSQVRKIQQWRILRNSPTPRDPYPRLKQQHCGNEPGTTLPTMPMKKKRNYNRVVVYDSSGRDSNLTDGSADEGSSDTEDITEDTNLRAEIGREIKRLRAQTPTLTSPIGCSTELANNPTQPDHSRTPIHGQEIEDTAETGEELTGKLRSKQKTNIEKTQTRTESEPRRPERIRSAQRVVKLGGVEYF